MITPSFNEIGWFFLQ